MLISVAVAAICLTVFAGAVELAAKQGCFNRESSRKLLHIAVAVAFAILPFYVSMTVIFWLAVIDIAIVFVAARLNLFKGVRHVGRQTWGEYFFLTALALGSFLTESPWVFAAGVLTLGFADSAAALVGKRYGKVVYKVLGQKKTLEGTLAFVFVTLVILTLMVNVGSLIIPTAIIILPALAVIASLCEALGAYGFDNFLIPIVLILILENTRLIEDFVSRV